MIAMTSSEPAQSRRHNLTHSRRKILNLLISRQVVTHEAIINALWGDCIDGGPDNPAATIRAHICYLRSFLGDHEVTIETAMGVGYRIPTREMRDAARVVLDSATDWTDRRRASASAEITAAA